MPFACHQETWRGWGRSEWKWSLLSGLFLSLHFAFWIASLKYTSVASSVVLVTTHPVFVGIGAWFFLKERPGLNLIFGIASLRFGERIDQLRGYEPFERGFDGGWVCPSGSHRCIRIPACGKKNEKGSQPDLLYLPGLFNGRIHTDSLRPCFSKSFFRYSSSTYLYLFLLALVPQLIGHTTFNWALKYLPATVVAISILGEPIGSTLLAYFILGEGLTVWKILGGISIFAGILMAFRKKALNYK